MPSKTGRFAIIEQLLADGITHMFGNPGTVEQGFLDALEEYPAMQYITTLQETIAVGDRRRLRPRDAAADASCSSTAASGSATAIGMMYQAKRGDAPLVVIAGEAGVRYDSMDAQMAADLVSMARPVTKWSTRVIDPTSTLRVLRRAIKIAATPPCGPVFVALPMDVLDAERDEDVVPTSIPGHARRADDEAVRARRRAARRRRAADAIVGDGDRVRPARRPSSRASPSCSARRSGARTASEVEHRRRRIRSSAASSGTCSASTRKAITSQADAVLIVGTYVFPEVFPALEGVFAPGAQVVHIDLDAYEIAKNFPVDLGLVADPKADARPARRRARADALRRAARRGRRRAARDLGAQKQQELDAAAAHDREFDGDTPMHPSTFMAELARQVPDDVVDLRRGAHLVAGADPAPAADAPGHYFCTRGGSLGVGFPGAIGVKLAMPDKTVIGFSGDGGAMYTIQALWTAAHHDIGAKFVVCNNRSYQLLKLNVQQYWRERELPDHDVPGARSTSVTRRSASTSSRGAWASRPRASRPPSEVGPAIAEALAEPGPYLIDLVLHQEVPGHDEDAANHRPVAGTRAHS